MGHPKIEGGHFYPVNDAGDIVYPSVTTVIHNVIPEDPAITSWKARNKNWKGLLNYSAVLGTLVHFRILNKLSDTLLPLPEPTMAEWEEPMEAQIEIAEIMFDELDLDLGYPRNVEFLLINHNYKYAGRCDLLAPLDLHDGKGYVQTLIDLKTSREARATHKLQMGGYYDAIPDNKKPQRAVLVCIHPYEKNNPSLEGHTVKIEMKELLGYRDRFRTLATDFHKKFDYSTFAANQDGYATEKKSSQSTLV